MITGPIRFSKRRSLDRNIIGVEKYWNSSPYINPAILSKRYIIIIRSISNAGVKYQNDFIDLSGYNCLSIPSAQGWFWLSLLQK